MIDIFDEKISFEMFIRHCTHELSVESILFLIEIAQFKATLNKYNAYGINKLNFRFIEANQSNFVKYIKEQRDEKINKQLIIHPAPKCNKDENTLPHTNSLANSLIPPLSPSMASCNDDSVDIKNECTNTSNTEYDTPPPQSPPPPSAIPDPITITMPPPQSNKYALTPQLSVSNVINLKNKNESIIASSRQEIEYKTFQETVLQKKWLPIARPLLAAKELSNKIRNGSRDREKSKTGSITGTGTGTRTLTLGTTSTHSNNKTKTKSKTPFSTDSARKLKFSTSKTKLSSNAYIQPISLAVIEDSTFNTKHMENNNNNHTTVDINWIYEFGRHLYLKYVDNGADLAINISHLVRKNLWTVYGKEINEEAFQTIQLIHHHQLTTIGRLTHLEEQLFIQTYLYHSFDMAFHSVWCLLKSDTFYRFQRTNAYKTLCKELDVKKLKEARDKREREYSHSCKETNLDI